MGFETIPAKDIDRYVGQPGVFIIDLRERVEFRSQHIRGAYNIPYEELDSICAITLGGDEILLIKDGKFVLSGTETLNEPLTEIG